jgi:hypothetical protein
MATAKDFYRLRQRHSSNIQLQENLVRTGVRHNNHSNISQVPFASPSIIAKKRKRRQWTVSDELRAVDYFETTNDKQQTVKYMRCATKQVRMSVKNKSDLLDTSFRKKR